MIDNSDAVKLLDSKRDNAIFVATMNANNVHFGLPTVTSNEKLDFPVSGAMSKASDVALGLALAQPDRKIMCLDGDGSLLMNMGSLVTIAGQAPKNLIHFVAENGTYEANGGHPIPGRGQADFAGFARAAGYASAQEFSDLADFEGGLGTLLQAEGPVFASLKIEPGPPPEMDYRMMHGAQIRDDFRAALDPEIQP